MSFYGPSIPPPITHDALGLPHCSRCEGETLCIFHRNQIEKALKGLSSAHLLATAQVDVRYLVGRRTPDAEA